MCLRIPPARVAINHKTRRVSTAVAFYAFESPGYLPLIIKKGFLYSRAEDHHNRRGGGRSRQPSAVKHTRQEKSKKLIQTIYGAIGPFICDDLFFFLLWSLVLQKNMFRLVGFSLLPMITIACVIEFLIPYKIDPKLSICRIPQGNRKSECSQCGS